MKSLTYLWVCGSFSPCFLEDWKHVILKLVQSFVKSLDYKNTIVIGVRIITGAVVLRCSSKQVFLKLLQFHRKKPELESRFNKAFRPAALLKRDSNRGVSLRNVRNCYEHHFLPNISGGYFWTGDRIALRPTYLACCSALTLFSFSSFSNKQNEVYPHQV